VKKLSIISIVFALVLSIVPAMAASDESISGKEPATFHALSRMPSGKHAALSPLTDNQLASIEGGGSCFVCTGVNIAVLVPINISVLSTGVTQGNLVLLSQSISFPQR
jgi:bacteriocin-like protein